MLHALGELLLAHVELDAGLSHKSVGDPASLQKPCRMTVIPYKTILPSSQVERAWDGRDLRWKDRINVGEDRIPV